MYVHAITPIIMEVASGMALWTNKNTLAVLGGLTMSAVFFHAYIITKY